MNGTFRLSTLQRLRAAKLAQRGRDLHAASLALVGGRVHLDTLKDQLAGSGVATNADHGDVVLAAGYRDRLREELVESQETLERLSHELDAARGAWVAARADLRAVEVLQERHLAAVRAAAARREQRELDDLAGRRHLAAAGAGARR